MIQVDLKRRYVNRQQKLATCLAKLLQNVLNSDIARFSTHESNLSCSKSAYHQVALYEKVLQKVEGSFFLHQNLYISCVYRPKTDVFYNKCRTSCARRDSRVIVSNQMPAIKQLSEQLDLLREV